MPEVVSSADSRAVTVPRTGVRIAVLLVAACVACLSVAGIFLIASPPASAHDQLLSSDPADGDELDVMPGAITLTFSGEPLETGAEVVLTGEDGTPVGLEDLAVDGTVLTASLPSTLPGGEYDVAWHIVSGDGHPLEGAFSFTVDTPSEPSATAEDDASSPDTESAAPADVPEPTETAGAAEDGGTAASDTPTGIPSGAAALAVIGAVLVVLIMLIAMRRRMKETEAMRARRQDGESAGEGSEGGDRPGSSGGDGGTAGSSGGS